MLVFTISGDEPLCLCDCGNTGQGTGPDRGLGSRDLVRTREIRQLMIPLKGDLLCSSAGAGSSSSIGICPAGEENAV